MLTFHISMASSAWDSKQTHLSACSSSTQSPCAIMQAADSKAITNTCALKGDRSDSSSLTIPPFFPIPFAKSYHICQKPCSSFQRNLINISPHQVPLPERSSLRRQMHLLAVFGPLTPVCQNPFRPSGWTHQAASHQSGDTSWRRFSDGAFGIRLVRINTWHSDSHPLPVQVSGCMLYGRQSIHTTANQYVPIQTSAVGYLLLQIVSLYQIVPLMEW